MPIKPKENSEILETKARTGYYNRMPNAQSLDEKKRDAIKNSVDARGYKKGGMAKAKMMAGGGMHRMPDGRMMKDSAMKSGGMAKAKMMAGGGMMKKGYAAGGMPMTMKDGKRVPTFAADGKGAMAKGGTAKAKMMAGGGMGKVPTGKPAMGSASKRADGIAMKGKTDTKQIAMKKGGMTKMKKGGYC